MSLGLCSMIFFFFNDTATTEIYTLSLHDALPICRLTFERRPRGDPFEGLAAIARMPDPARVGRERAGRAGVDDIRVRDRKSTRLNSSHSQISYAVFCLKKKSGFLSRACTSCTA